MVTELPGRSNPLNYAIMIHSAEEMGHLTKSEREGVFQNIQNSTNDRTCYFADLMAATVIHNW